MFVLLSFCLSPAGDVTNKCQLRPTKVVHYNEITANKPTKNTLRYANCVKTCTILTYINEVVLTFNISKIERCTR